MPYTPLIERKHPFFNKTEYLFAFENNNYGASVIKTEHRLEGRRYLYLYELSIIRFTSWDKSDFITLLHPDMTGWLTWDAVQAILVQIDKWEATT